MNNVVRGDLFERNFLIEYLSMLSMKIYVCVLPLMSLLLSFQPITKCLIYLAINLQESLPINTLKFFIDCHMAHKL